MIYTIIAAMLFILTLGVILSANYRGSYIAAKIRGNIYYRECTPVCAKVEKLIWSKDGNAFAICSIDGDKSEIEILLKKTPNHMPKSLWLIQSKIKDGMLYSPVSFHITADAPFILKIHDGELSPDECEKLNVRIKRAYIPIWIMIMGAIPSIATRPLLAIFIEIIAIYLSFMSVPFKDWTKSKKCCIIEERKGQSHSADDKPDSSLPLGFNEWSPTEKELFGIETRTHDDLSENLCKDPYAKADWIAPDENPEWIRPDKTNLSDALIKTEISLPSSLTPSACKNCGCVIDDGITFCPHCGERILPLQKSTNSAVPTQTIANELTAKVTQNTEQSKDITPWNNTEGERNNNKKKNRHHRSRSGNTNSPNSELGNVLSAAEESLF